MQARPLLGIAVLLAAIFAGCASNADQPAKAAALNTTTNTTPLVDDGSKSLNASASEHMASMPHMHDYWKGKERVTLFDGQLQPNEENATFATITQVLLGRYAAGGMQWWLPDGATVYEGAGAMELTASWTDPRVTGIGFVYQSAESKEFKSGGALPNGQAFHLPLTPAMTDPPHTKVSKWWFGFGADKSPGAVMGPFHLKVDIVRMNDIMLFPAHPDFWQGKTNLTLVNTDHHGSQVSYAARATQPVTNGGDFQEDWVNLTGIVPAETKTMQYTFTVTSASSTPGQVDSFGLFYRAADSTGNYRCAIQKLDKLPATLTWTIPVTAENADSPYAKTSQWRFLLEPQASLTGQDSTGGMTNVDYAYHATVTATDVDGAEPKACSYEAPQGGG